MTTGVDAQTCQLIVLDRTIESQTEFKQIIGRGTRINTEFNKLFFTIMDFRQATAQFADPTFDGPPEQIYEPPPDQPVVPPDLADGDAPPSDAATAQLPGGSDDLYSRIAAMGRRVPMAAESRPKYHVDDVDVAVVTERVQYLDEHGKLITESLDEYTRRKVKARYESLAALLAAWQAAPHKGAFLETLGKSGVFIEELAAQYADLFLVLLMKILKDGGRAGLVLPDGTLFGEGVKTRIKEALLTECNLHTIVRLPNGVFNPYTGIRTNLLFFEKGSPTREVWYYEHPYPPGAKSYNKTKPIRIEEFDAEKAWWVKREENEQAWRVSIDQIRAGGFNLDLKNPHRKDDGPGDVEHLLPEYEKLLAQIAETREKLKTELHAALTATTGAAP